MRPALDVWPLIPSIVSAKEHEAGHGIRITRIEQTPELDDMRKSVRKSDGRHPRNFSDIKLHGGPGGLLITISTNENA